MNLYDNSTYPPPTTSVPPSPPTAVTGFPASTDWMLPAILVLVVMGAAALRIARLVSTRPRTGDS